MRRILKSELDKFYTKDDIAIKCISKINISKYDIAIDPCCGDGAFLSNINIPKIGIDLEPNIENAIQHDFLTWNHSEISVDRSKVIVISNPPFGKQGSLAMNFIKKASEFSDTIAFILPLSFSKNSIKNRIPINYHLTYEEILPENSFLLNDSDYLVKCVFQVWERKDNKRELIETIKESGFTYTKKQEEADFSIRRVGFYAGKASTDVSKSIQSHYFIKVEDKYKVSYIIENINKQKWTERTVGPKSISKNELNPVINNLLTNFH
jgi:predicted RNA methylase